MLNNKYLEKNNQHKIDIKMTQIVTIFKNIKETQAPFHKQISVVLNRIKDGATKELVKKYVKNQTRQTDRN